MNISVSKFRSGRRSHRWVIRTVLCLLTAAGVCACLTPPVCHAHRQSIHSFKKSSSVTKGFYHPSAADKVLYDFEGESFWASFIEKESYWIDAETREPIMDGWSQDSLYYSIADLNEDGKSTLFFMSRERNKPMCHMWVWMRDRAGVPFLAAEADCYDSFVMYSKESQSLVLSNCDFREPEWVYHTLYRLEDGAPCVYLRARITRDGTMGFPECYIMQGDNPEKIDYREFQARYESNVILMDWKPLLPHPVRLDETIEDISSMLDAEFENFTDQFSGLEPRGSFPITYTNSEVFATPLDDGTICEVGISSMGVPYSIKGIRCGMDVMDAIRLAESHGGTTGPQETGRILFSFPNDVLLEMDYENSAACAYVSSVRIRYDSY